MEYVLHAALCVSVSMMPHRRVCAYIAIPRARKAVTDERNKNISKIETKNRSIAVFFVDLAFRWNNIKVPSLLLRVFVYKYLFFRFSFRSAYFWRQMAPPQLTISVLNEQIMQMWYSYRWVDFMPS